jgi:hypothetical protein
MCTLFIIVISNHSYYDFYLFLPDILFIYYEKIFFGNHITMCSNNLNKKVYMTMRGTLDAGLT